MSLEVKNTGKMAGDEMVQAYLEDLEASVRVPRWQLVAVRRVSLEPSHSQERDLHDHAESRWR